MDLGKSNLNRSFSEPDVYSSPSCFRRVSVKEYYQFPNQDKPQIRHYTYTEVVGGFNGSNDILCESKRCWSEKSLCESSKLEAKCLNYSNSSHLQSQLNDQSFSSLFQKKEEVSNKEFNSESLKLSHIGTEEAMDVDDDSNYKETYDYNDSSDFDSSEFNDIRRGQEDIRRSQRKPGRKLNTNSVTSHRHKKQRDNSKFLYTGYFIVPTIIALFFYVLWLHPSQNKNEAIHPDLNNILYQDHVVQITSQILSDLNEKNSKEVLVFVGTTGVGKTHLVNLIKKHFHKEFVIDLNIDLQNHFKVVNKLSQKGCNFIIIDNLKIENLKAVTLFINTLPDQCILVIPVFNIHEVNDDLTYTTNIDHFKKIKEKFEHQFSSMVNVVLFNNINRDTIEKWLRRQIEEKGLSAKEETISSLLEKHNVEVYGFKGLVSELNLLES